MTWLLAVMLMPLMNTEWTCTLDAYIHCRLWENKEIVQELDYIDPVTQYREKTRNSFKNSWYEQHTQGILQRLESVGKIKNYYEIAPRETPKPPFILEVRSAERDNMNMRSGESEINHAMCAVWETETHWIVWNDWGTDWGIGGFGYVKKGNYVYHDFE